MSAAAHHGSTEFNQTDSMVERNRLSRAIVAFVSPVIALDLSYNFAAVFVDWLKLPYLLQLAGEGAGIWLGVKIGIHLWRKSIIANRPLVAILTINPLISLLNLGNALVPYGPGKHFCYWWEQRDKENIFFLKEADDETETEFQCTDGSVKVSYSWRMRPDIRRLPEFKAGVGAASLNFGGLISTKIGIVLGKKPVKEALVSYDELNEMLEDVFHHNEAVENEEHGHTAVTDFEERFGVITGDVTVGVISPTKEVKETANALTEHKMLDQIVCETLGYTSTKELREAKIAGHVTDEEENRVRTYAMAMSGNLQGMNLGEQTYNVKISGLDHIDPNLVEVAKSLGPIAARLAPNQSNTKQAKGGKK